MCVISSFTVHEIPVSGTVNVFYGQRKKDEFLIQKGDKNQSSMPFWIIDLGPGYPLPLPFAAIIFVLRQIFKSGGGSLTPVLATAHFSYPNSKNV